MYQYRCPLVAPQVRLELTTLRLTAECSAIELLRIIHLSLLRPSRTPQADLSSEPLHASSPCLSLAAHAPPDSLPILQGIHASAALKSRSSFPILPYYWKREKLPFPPLPLDPGDFLLSQAVPSLVPSAFGGLTSVFGMGTGGSLQLSSPETFSLPLRPLRLHSRFCFAPSLTLAQAFRLRSASALSKRFRFALTPHLQNCTGSRVDQLSKHSS